MNMFKAVKATSVQEYFDMLPEERREPMEFLHKFIQKAAPSLKPHFAYNMPGYGSFKYKNSKKEELDWPTIGLASQKNYISIYLSTDEGELYQTIGYLSSPAPEQSTVQGAVLYTRSSDAWTQTTGGGKCYTGQVLETVHDTTGVFHRSQENKEIEG